MREKENYRDMLMRLDMKYPDREFLSQAEAADFAGCSTRTVKRHYGNLFKDGLGISKVQLARALS